jgi:hypothetical protein
MEGRVVNFVALFKAVDAVLDALDPHSLSPEDAVRALAEALVFKANDTSLTLDDIIAMIAPWLEPKG